MPDPLLVSVPTPALLHALESSPDGVEAMLWDMSAPAPRDAIDVVVPPYMSDPRLLTRLEGVRTRLVQSQSIGYDGVAQALPAGMSFANAASVHETSTAELALALVLAAQRGIPDFVRAAATGRWASRRYESLADRRVLIVGYGNVGAAIEARLAPFEVEVLRVASRARRDDRGVIHGTDALPGLLPTVDIVIVVVPLREETRHLVGAGFLASMPDGALLVNVARGPVVDTDALLAEVASGRLRAALDVTDPEPLPADHPLWSLPNALISPHVGGNSSAMGPRFLRLLRRQIDALRDGREPENIVLRS